VLCAVVVSALVLEPVPTADETDPDLVPA